jgi:TonB family protein
MIARRRGRCFAMLARSGCSAVVLVLAITPRAASAESVLDLLERNASDGIIESQQTRLELQLVFAAFRDARCSGVDVPADAIPDVAALTKYFLQDGVEAAFFFASGLYITEPLYQEAVLLATDDACKSPRSQRIYLNLYRLLAKRSREMPAATSSPRTGPSPPARTRLEREGVAEVTAGIVPPSVVSQVDPVYPDKARNARVQGVVILRCIVEADGTVSAAEVVKGLPFGLGESAVEAVKKWRFRPASRNGQPLAVYHNVSVSLRP